MKVLRTFARVYASDIDSVLQTFRAAGLDATPERRFTIAHAGIDVCVTADTVIVAGDDRALAPVRSTQLTWVVDDLDGALETLSPRVTAVVKEPGDVPTGRNATVVLGDVQVELVEWIDPPD